MHITRMIEWTLADLFKQAVPTPTIGFQCWEWTGRRYNQGYGWIYIAGRQRVVHRVVWELLHGPIPPGYCICHHCDTPSCINPEHLWQGTHAENIRDAARKHRMSRKGGAYSKLRSHNPYFVPRDRSLW
jgi:hypothetical protein